MRPVTLASSRARRLAAAAVLVAATTGAAHAACPVQPFYLDLKSGVTATNPQISFKLPAAAVTAAGCAGWKKAVLKINLAGCTQANVVVEYEGLPSGWTVNLGDSPTNDGYAGDAGTTKNNAELWVLHEQLSIANASNDPNAIDNPLLRQDLSLINSALKFVVKNQFVSWGQPYGVLAMPATKRLFAVPDTAVPAEASYVYLGLNQVITGRADRQGCGARRVLITLQ
jgi:hypothetical protein